MHLDHITIVAGDCSFLRQFFVEVAGLTEGPRPPFGRAGHWLYLGQQPVLHLIERIVLPARHGISNGPPATRIDHLALRIDSHPEWQALLQRLHVQRLRYRIETIDALQERQLFVAPVPGVKVEFVIAERHLAAT